MGREIERKFLVSNNEWREEAEAFVAIRQGYLCVDPDRTVRVRLAGEQGWLTVKGRSRGRARPEFEYAIPREEAAEMLETLCLGALVEKIRHRVRFAGMAWEVDEFTGENQGLILAEIELDDEGQPFEMPSWVGREVTGDPRFANSTLAHLPSSRWAKDPPD